MKTLLAVGAAAALLLTCAIPDEASAARVGYGRGGAVGARGVAVRGGYARGGVVRGGYYARGGAVRGGYYARRGAWGAPGWRAAAVGATALGAAAAYGTYGGPGYYGAPGAGYVAAGYYGAPRAEVTGYGAPGAVAAAAGYYRGGWNYASWDEYAKINGIKCQPGTTIKMDDGLTHLCQ